MLLLRFLSLSLSCQHIDHLPFTIYYYYYYYVSSRKHQWDVKENDPGGAKRRSPVLTVFGTHKQNLHVDSLRADFVPQVQDYFEQSMQNS